MTNISYQSENGFDVSRDNFGRKKLDKRLEQVESFVIVLLRRDQLLEHAQQRLQLVARDNLKESQMNLEFRFKIALQIKSKLRPEKMWNVKQPALHTGTQIQSQMMYLLWSSWNVRLEKSNKCVDVSGPFPKHWNEEELKELHVGLRHVALRVVLEQQGQDLEDVWDELLHILGSMKQVKFTLLILIWTFTKKVN